MKKIILIILAIFYSTTPFSTEFDSKISGEIWWTQAEKGEGKLQQGVLIIRAFTLSTGIKKILAETTIEKPSFPQLFLLGPKQTKIAGEPFVGPFELEISYLIDGKVTLAIPVNEKLVPNGKRNNIYYLNP